MKCKRYFAAVSKRYGSGAVRVKITVYYKVALTSMRNALPFHIRVTFIKSSIFFLVICMVSLIIPIAPAGAQNNFPVYKVIQPNVAFWEDIYGTYSSRKGILHDRNDLNIVYTVIDLVNWDAPESRQINQKLIKLARQRVKNILSELGHGKKPATTEEKRIAALFPKQRHTRYLKARENIRLQIGQKDRFKQGVIRSGKYISQIKTIFRHYGLPAELAYLPHVESSFNPHAKSKAGAAGLWQFTRATGKDYMRINQLIDERLDPFLATHAAAKLLKENYSRLETWPLALTAYNYGRSGMLRAVKEQKNYPSIFSNYRKGHFKFASRNFYSEFLAATKVARKLGRDRKLLPDRPEATKTLRLEGYASSQNLQSFFRVSKQDFARLNPALKKPLLDGTKLIPEGYLLRLPATKQVRLRLSQWKKSMYAARQLPDTLYTVQKGDTLSTIAKRYRTTTHKLKTLNNLNRHSIIKIGQKLALPSSKGNIVILKNISKKKPI